MVNKAIVLAAGLGTRLRPLTCAVPKPLLPVWGEPMLARIVALLRERGVGDIVVNCHYLHGQVEAWCATNGCRASREPEILGTGGVLNPLREWIGGEPFYLVNGDIVVENVPRLPEPTGDAIATCLVTEDGPRTIEVEPESRFVTCWKSPDPGWCGTFTYCGFACLRPEILDYVEPTGFSSIVQAYEKAMMAGRFVQAFAADDLLWTDAGTIASYVELNRDGDENAFAALPQLQAAASAAGLNADSPVEFLGARGSDRAFFRASGSVIVVYDDAKRGENARYAGHARWLKTQGVPVPEVRAELPGMKTLVLEDAGAVDLRKRVEKAGPRAIESYVPVVEALAKFNALGQMPKLPSLEPAFDAGLWRWERDLFAEHCLGGRFMRRMPPAVEVELGNVASLLAREPVALVHRDFQSTNVIWKMNEFRFIDFQGMRLGPAAYDLASLLYDPYVRLSEGERRALAALYGKVSGRSEIVNALPYAAVQRLCQALGAYGRLASVGQPQFGKYVLPALENLLAAADEAGLEATGALAEDLIAVESQREGHDHACHCHHDHGTGCSCHSTPDSEN